MPDDKPSCFHLSGPSSMCRNIVTDRSNFQPWYVEMLSGNAVWTQKIAYLESKVTEVMPQTELASNIKNFFDALPEVRVAIMFGSGAHGRLTATSDIDVAVAADSPFGSREKIRLAGELASVLGRNVDLVDLLSVSGTILQQALCRGKIIKVDGRVYPLLIKKMWFNQADMMPLTLMVLNRHCQRFIDG